MYKVRERSWVIALSCVMVFSVLITSCGSMPTEAPPTIVPPNLANNNGTYVNILLNSVEFTGTVSNLGDTGNLQFIMVTSDDTGHAYALICPYGAVIPVHKGDKINPCQPGITYPKDNLQGNLTVLLIAMDVKNNSDLVDIGTNVVTSGLSTGLGIAIQGTSAMTPELAVGLIALGTVIGYAGTKAEEYFQRNYVIGSQSFTMSSQYNWNEGKPIIAPSTNQQVNFDFVAEQSSSATGQLVQSATAPPAATEVPTVEVAVNPTSAPVSIGTISVPGNSNVGKTFTPNQTGTYSFLYQEGAYSTYPLDKIASAGTPTWLTALRVYQNRQPVWNGVAIVNEDYRFADHGYFSTQDAAIQQAQNDELTLDLNKGDYLVFVAVDGKPYYSDNPGEVTFEIFYQPTP